MPRCFHKASLRTVYMTEEPQTEPEHEKWTPREPQPALRSHQVYVTVQTLSAATGGSSYRLNKGYPYPRYSARSAAGAWAGHMVAELGFPDEISMDDYDRLQATYAAEFRAIKGSR